MNDPEVLKHWVSVEDLNLIRSLPLPDTQLFAAAREVRFWFQLAKSHPALAVMVASCPVFDGEPAGTSGDRMKDYVTWKRKRLCKQFGFPESEETVRLLLRLDRTAIDVRHLLALRSILKESGVFGLLKTRKTITSYLIASISLCDCCESGDLAALERFLKLPYSVRLLLSRHFEQADSSLSGIGPHSEWELSEVFDLSPRPFGQFRTPLKFLRHLDEVRRKRERFVAAVLGVKRQLVWPSPPIPGADTILPIDDQEALEREGRLMQHCAAQYKWQVILGQVFFYKILEPERATLALRFLNERWEVMEISGFQNAEVSPNTMRCVEEWLRTNMSQAGTTSSYFARVTEFLRAEGFPVKSSRF